MSIVYFIERQIRVMYQFHFNWKKSSLGFVISRRHFTLTSFSPDPSWFNLTWSRHIVIWYHEISNRLLQQNMFDQWNFLSSSAWARRALKPSTYNSSCRILKKYTGFQGLNQIPCHGSDNLQLMNESLICSMWHLWTFIINRFLFYLIFSDK